MSSKNAKKTGDKVEKKEKIVKNNGPTIEEQYKKKSLHQHILDLPDTYIGSVQNDIINMYIYDEDENRIIKKDCNVVLGLYKIFDEIVVNAADNTVRDIKCNVIKINIDEKSGIISVYNNGSTIPIELHKEYNIYVPELIFGNLLTSGNYDQKGKIVGGKNGLGSKCLAPDTLIPLFNGGIKQAKDLTKEDKLIGDDGKIRNIKNIIKGNGQMYKIIQANGESYKVNDNHTLTLHMPDHKVIFWNGSENGWSVLWWNHEENCINKKTIKISQDTFKVTQAKLELEEFCKSIPDNNIVDMNIQDYIKLNETTKLRLAGIRGECVQWEHKDVELDPYVLGLWLGNGENDPELINYLEESGKKGYSLKKQLDKYNLVNNKHIPNEYIINDSDTRLKVLGGIIDTDETVKRDGTRIVITQALNHERLAQDIVFLSRSLGFYTSIHKRNTKYMLNGEKKKGEAYNINISGENISDIPTLLPRKKCSGDRIHSSKTTGYLKVNKIEISDYIGFEIDDNQRFLINDFTVTHNCANIYSELFEVEISDPIRKKKYNQKFTNNMFDKEEPIITDISKSTESYTKITFKPDYKRFGLKNLNKDMASLLKRRAYDLAGNTNTNVKVYLNDKYLDIKSFEDYIKMFYTEDENIQVIYQEFNSRWSVGVVYDNNSGFQHMTFVNKISTFLGGTHLNMIVNQIVDGVTKTILDKHKTLKIKPSQIKDNITVFINSTIEDPSFSSQSKESLTTKSSLFNIKCDIDDKFIQKICKTGLVDELVQLASVKQLAELEKSDGKKNVNLKNLTKLDDARLAGSKRSSECRLILTEGDSAKSFAMSGLEVIGRDKYGVFPLKGKLLNVREANPKQLLGNEEIKNLKQILGLKQNQVYNDTKKLRYGGIVILTDQDCDGYHIKGLLMNFFHYFWPSLLKIEGFIQSIATPIIKVFKKSDSKKANPEIFYTLAEYKKWTDKVNDSFKNYTIKYYKGLGTSTAKEAKESFTDLEDRIVNYVWTLDSSKLNKNIKSGSKNKDDIDEYEEDEDLVSNKSAKSKNSSDKSDEDIQSVSECENDKLEPSYQALTLAFAKQRSNDRKEWVRKFDPEVAIDFDKKKITFDEFVNKDLIQFSHEDNIRSIPNISDGLKPSQRKILYGAFKRKLDNEEIKVAQLSGYISEHTGYHHGEASLQGAIINMAQDYCGSNNLNLLKPLGNFGSRRMGGKDAASARYIFTQLSDLTRNIFINKDEAVLKYNIEEGDVVEPESYYPIIPMILVNGSEGIGTGFSTNIPPHNPVEIISNLKKYLKGTDISELDELNPWFRGFIGTIEKINENTYNSVGKITVISENCVHIKELPIGTWTQDYIDFLSGLVQKEELIYDYENNSGNVKIDIKLYFKNNELQKLIKSNTLEKKLKIISTIKTSNMHLYKKNIITKYHSANHILKDYVEIRLEMYEKRKKYHIKVLENEMLLLKYRKKFIEQILSKKIVIERRKKTDIVQDLINLKYPELATSINSKPSYDYLTNLPLFSLTLEKIDELNKDYDEKSKELDIYMKMTVQDLWINELDLLIVQYNKWINYMDEMQDLEENQKNKKINKSTKKNNKEISKTKITIQTDDSKVKNTKIKK